MSKYVTWLLALFSGLTLVRAGQDAARPAMAAGAPGTARAVVRFNAIDSTPILDFFNGRPMPKNAIRVLFIGDSLTIHGKAPHLWDHWGGMAAENPSDDFVHLVSTYLQARVGSRPVEVLYDNGGDGRLPSMLSYLDRNPQLRPSLVVLQGGENDVFNGTFRERYARLLDYYRGSGVPEIVLGDFFSDTKGKYEAAEARARRCPFVDLRAIARVPANTGYGGPFNVPGVARHPDMDGMRAIASGIEQFVDPGLIRQLQAN